MTEQNNEQNANVGEKEYNLTLILCILTPMFGIHGVHRFYTGHIVPGIIQLLTFGGCGIWWIIDLINIATNKFLDADGKALKK